MIQIDVLTRLGGTVVEESGGTRVRLEDVNVILVGRTPEQVVLLLNDAIHQVFGRYSANLAIAGLELPIVDLERLVCLVVLNRMYTLNVMIPPNHRAREWIGFSEYDITGDNWVRHSVQRFCAQVFGEDSQRYAAAVLGMSIEKFALWEKFFADYSNR